jgi:hypothetical protein
MPRPNPNFNIGMGVTITNLLDLTKPKHFKTKILKWNLFAIVQISPIFLKLLILT